MALGGPVADLAKPSGPGPHPGVVLGAEAYGTNTFILGVQERLVDLGYAAAVPDFYHGEGPTNREAYDDFDEVIEHIGRLDFVRGDIAAAILFFPSQPVFHEPGPKTPVNPLDLLWQLTCPTLFLYGDEDPVMPPELLDDLRERIDRWGVDAEIREYAGATHAFAAPWGPMRNDEADRASWDDAVAFLRAHTGTP